MSEGEHLAEAMRHLQKAMVEEPTGQKPATAGLVEKIKDNIAYILGLPAAITGAFGFLWESSAEEAALSDQVAQLEAAVADLQVGSDLLGGGTKNFSLDPSTTSGSITLMLVAAGVVIFIGALVFYHKRRHRK
jgi:hypothetical protein